jgi:hypothetical protein
MEIRKLLLQLRRASFYSLLERMKLIPHHGPAGLRYLDKLFGSLRRVFRLDCPLSCCQKLRSKGGLLRRGLVKALLQGGFLLLKGGHHRF